MSTMYSLSVLVPSVLLLSLVNGASDSDCVYTLSPLPNDKLNLSSFAGEVLMYKGNNLQWTYSICSDSLQCIHNSDSQQAMVEMHPIGINECRSYGRYNSSVQPFYDFAIASWIFNYSNGEPCPDRNQQENRTTAILWNCNPLLSKPFIVDAFEYDSCNVLVQIDWKGACVAETIPNERCIFHSGLQSLDLSSIKGHVLTYQDEGNLTWSFSPCDNKLECMTSHGTKLSVMSQIEDQSGQCAKFLGVWSGDVIPFYERNVFGSNYWDFFWMDGEECGAGGPLQVLNVRYYCNPNAHTARITSAGGIGACQFRIEIDSHLACNNASYVDKIYKR
eukprot:442944_1